MSKSDPYEIPLKDYENVIFGGKMNINIVKDYKWHTGLATDMPPPHVPRMLLHEFEISNSNLYSGLLRSGSMMIHDNPYAGMYVGEATGRRFILPYLSDFTWEASVAWEPVEAGGDGNGKGNQKGNVLQKAKDWIADKTNKAVQLGAGVRELFDTATAFVENTAERWHKTDVKAVETKFSLINTNSEPESWIKNYRFCQYLRAACLHDQRNVTKASPPPIYTMLIPGMIYSPACYMSELKIKQVGSVMPLSVLARLSNGAIPALNPVYEPNYKQIYIPDSWEITMGFSWLVMPSRQTQIYGINNMRYEIPAITNPLGDESRDLAGYGFYLIGEEFGQQAADNAGLYETQSNAKLFDLKNATQEAAQGALTDG